MLCAKQTRSLCSIARLRRNGSGNPFGCTTIRQTRSCKSRAPSLGRTGLDYCTQPTRVPCLLHKEHQSMLDQRDKFVRSSHRPDSRLDICMCRTVCTRRGRCTNWGMLHAPPARGPTTATSAAASVPRALSERRTRGRGVPFPLGSPQVLYY